MAFYPGLYPGRLYVPDPWHTTWVPQHFPEHHYPLEHIRHALSHRIGQVGHELGQIGHDFLDINPGPHMLSPRIDTLESKKAFYIDVELPGLESEDKMKLRWIGSNTLLLEAVVGRQRTPEDEVAREDNSSQPTEEEAAMGTQAAEVDNKDQIETWEKKEPAVYLTLNERPLGLYARAFNFPVDVHHEKTTAKLNAGLLRITVPKMEEAKQVDKTVKVENDGRRSAL
ncbi:hypothetical protein LTR96_011003 [Exophiala xenobiotica]|nr:hypothetical protein LTR41_011122 [Exophiala xenobiotica]KAK5215909.1 hypothetical protein LTR72_011081 [Exophiala xenobiotica]KAK5220332.1 hypothetical protein LTR47_011229 [Exophiala xenobiotica]KAK5245919.1 hypothetical protein LTS06_008701 [Exophiala xenobiotica]KAK5261497.1 hypothetical protein LTR40_002083 [Exophiala xenobiotica]